MQFPFLFKTHSQLQQQQQRDDNDESSHIKLVRRMNKAATEKEIKCKSKAKTTP